MKDFDYVLQNFFTHKDYLVAPELIPGTIYTPLQFLFEAILLAIIIGGAIFVSRRHARIRPVLITLWILLILWEVVIGFWDTLAGENKAFDWTLGLSLYPCSIFLYAMPFAIWGKGVVKKIACGYVCTLGMLGAGINFLYPISRLTTYSCISFPGFHTFFFHGTMLFTFLVMIFSGYHRYTNVTKWWELFLPCIPSLIVSIPANIINYSPINADYMYFRGRFFVLAMLFKNCPDYVVTFVLYLLYIFVPALFYLPSFLMQKHRNRQQDLTPAAE